MALTQLTKIDGGGISTTSDYRVGVITATKFIGPFEGSTGTFSGNITAVDGTFSGNVTVGGTLTYEDVTNIDSVGVITARSSVQVEGNLNIADKIRHLTDTNTALRFPAADTITAETAGEERLRIESGGDVGIGTDDPHKRLHVANYGNHSAIRVEASGNTKRSGIEFYRESSAGVGKGAAAIWVESDTSSSAGKLRFGTASNAAVQSQNTDMILDVYGRLGIGTDNPAEVLHVLQSGTTAAEFRLENSEGHILLRSDNNLATYDAQQHIFRSRDGSDEYGKFDSNGRLGIGTNNPTVPLQINHVSPKIILEDNDNGADVSIANVGGAAVYSSASDVVFQTSDTSEKVRITAAGGKVGIGTNNPAGNVEIDAASSTTEMIMLDVAGTNFAKIGHNSSSGVAVLDVRSEGHIRFLSGGNNERLRITNTGNVGIGSAVPTLGLDINKGANSGVFLGNPTHGYKVRANVTSSNDYGLLIEDEDGVDLYRAVSSTGTSNANTHTWWTAGEERLRIDSNGHITPGAAGTQDLGSALKEFRHLYLGDAGKAYFGLEQDMSMTFDSSNASIELNTGDFSIIAYDNNKDVKILSDNGSGGVANYFVADGSTGEALLHHYGSQKLATSTTGISVTGEVAATQDYPNQRPSVDFNFVSVKKLDPRFTYRCTGTASYIDEFGKVVLVGDNTPRFDHDPETRECKGLLIEEQRTNLWLQSEKLVDYVTGGNLQQSTIANAGTSTKDPTGGYNATKMAADTNGGAHSIYKNFTNGSNGESHTFSVWVKAAGVDYARIYVDSVGGNLGGPGVTFSTGNTWNISASGVGTQVATSAVEYPNGWWRLSVTGSFSNRNDYYCHIDIEGGEGDISYTGNGSNGIYVWGVQFEKGGYATSYVPTNGSSATRGQGFAVIDGEELSDFYNPNASTVICQFDASNWVTYNPNKYERVWCFSNHNTETDTVEMFKQNSSNSQVRWRIRTSNTNVLGASNYTYSTTRPKLGFAWQLNDAGVSIDGGTLSGTGDSGIAMPSITQLSLGNSGIENNSGGHGLTGWIRRFIYYPIKVSDSQLITLTS